MPNIFKSFCILLILLLSVPHSLFAQKPSRKPTPPPANRPVQIAHNVIADLLAMKPLPPKEDEPAAEDANEGEEKPPADDAPTAKLVQYWLQRSDAYKYPKLPQPTETIRQRLLDELVNRPATMLPLLNFVPDNPATHDRLFNLLSQLGDDEEEMVIERAAMQEWLQRHSQYFRAELLAAAQGEQTAVDSREDSLAALAKLDWGTARPLLERLAAQPPSALGTLALGLLQQHAQEATDSSLADKYRQQLRQIVEQRQLDIEVRAKACESVMAQDWNGRDEWFLSLFADPTLSGFSEPKEADLSLMGMTRPGAAGGGMTDAKAVAAAKAVRASHADTGTQVLQDIVSKDEDRWIPLLTPLVGNANRTIHDAAVSALIGLGTTDEKQKEAMRPLLLMLQNPKAQ